MKHKQQQLKLKIINSNNFLIITMLNLSIEEEESFS